MPTPAGRRCSNSSAACGCGWRNSCTPPGSATAIIDGRRALTVEHVTRLRPEAAPDWPSGRGWKVSVEGLPSMVLESKIAVNDEDENDPNMVSLMAEWDSHDQMHASSEKRGEEFQAKGGTEGLEWETRIWHKLS